MKLAGMARAARWEGWVDGVDEVNGCLFCESFLNR